MRRQTGLLVILVMALSLSGCGWWKDYRARAKRTPNVAESQYQAGVEAFQEARFKRAIENFTRVKEQFPLHPLALLSEIGIADAHFSEEEWAEADLAYTDFLNLHPTNESVPYAMYQVGLCHYNQMYGIDRDQTETVRTAKDFERLIAKFPRSKFAFMAEKKLREVRQRMAENEFYVAEFYFKREKYKAALKRFEYLTKNYPDLGFDYQARVYMAETRKHLADEEARAARGEVKKKREEPQNRATGSW